jgi:hypothetical protein
VEWVLFAYRIPREPSAPRIAVWRKLRRLGALQLGDGLVTLPRTPQNQERLEWLADEVGEAGGQASLWFAQPASRAQQRELAERVSKRVAEEYATVLAAAKEAGRKDEPTRKRTVARLRRTLRAIRVRDWFDAPERRQAEQAVEALAAEVEVAR